MQTIFSDTGVFCVAGKTVVSFHQAEVARRVGVDRQSVSRWAEELERGGNRALRKAGACARKRDAGRKPKPQSCGRDGEE